MRKFGTSKNNGTYLSQTLSSRQVDRVRDDSLTVELVDNTYSTSRSCLLHNGQLQPSKSISLICGGFVVQLVSTVVQQLTRFSLTPRYAVRLW